MAPPRSYQCEALTIGKSPTGEADLIVTLLTKDRGKVRAIARGGRRSTSKMVGHLEPLTQVRASLAQGRSLDYVTQVQILENFAALKNSLDGISKGQYAAELADGFASEASPNQPLYNLVVEVLHALNSDPESDRPLRFFELQLLGVSGLMPELYCCVECRQPLAPVQHRYSPTVGGTLCSVCQPAGAHVRPLSLRALKVLRLLHRGPLADIVGLNMSPDLAQEIKAVLAGTVSYWLDKEIQSNSFLEQLRRESTIHVYT